MSGIALKFIQSIKNQPVFTKIGIIRGAGLVRKVLILLLSHVVGCRNRALRDVSANMKTLHNEPNAVLVFPYLTNIHINFERGNTTLRDGKTVQRFDQLPEAYQQGFPAAFKPRKIYLVS